MASTVYFWSCLGCSTPNRKTSGYHIVKRGRLPELSSNLLGSGLIHHALPNAALPQYLKRAIGQRADR